LTTYLYLTGKSFRHAPLMKNPLQNNRICDCCVRCSQIFLDVSRFFLHAHTHTHTHTHTRISECNLIPSSVNFPTECHGWMLATDGWFLAFLVALFEMDAVDMAFENLYEIAAKHTWTEKAEREPSAIRYAGNGLQFSKWRITFGEREACLRAIPISFLHRTLIVFFPVRGISGGQKRT